MLIAVDDWSPLPGTNGRLKVMFPLRRDVKAVKTAM
jgi:hypothetical protein